MDPVENPYRPGAGVRPDALAGRDSELGELDVALARTEQGSPARGLALCGLRGVGKTVLLAEARRRAAGRGWLTAQFEAGGATRLEEALAANLRQSLRRVRAASPPTLRERIAAAFSAVSRFSLRFSPDGSFEAGVELGDQALPVDVPTGDLTVDLTDLFTDLSDTVEDLGVGVLVTVDEAQDLDLDTMRALLAAVHHMNQVDGRVLLVAGGLPSLPAVASEAQTYAERIFRYDSVGALDEQGASTALLEPAAHRGVEWDRDAAELVLAECRGYPYFLQVYGHHAWELAAGPGIDLEAARGALVEARHELDVGFYGSRWDRATPRERQYLQSVAAVAAPGGPAATGEVASHLDSNVQHLSPVRAELIRKGLLYAPEHGKVWFTVPGMDEYVRRA